jgi:DNA primase
VIPQEKIEEIKNANDIVEVAGNYLSMKRAGSNFKALCPFHSEKTPSFVISPQKQIYHCFGCNEGGNVFSFIQKEENLSFIEAVKFLAKRANIEIKDEYSSSPAYKEKEKLIEMNKIALEFFYSCLPKSEIAVAYAKKRNMTREIVDEFKLGFAPSGSHLYKLLKEKGFEDAAIEKSGLCQRRDDGFMDSFRERLMFPICSAFGDPIAFGGRVLDDSLPKYINLKETLAYVKSRNLYNLNNARKYKEDYIVIVEGYMDALALCKYNIKNTVATLGTALTDGQAALLKRYTSKAIIMYDSDDAGVSGASRGGEILFCNGLETKIASIEGYKDPDELAEKQGTQAVKERIEKALPFITFRARLAIKQGDIKNPYYKEKALKELADIIMKSDSAVIRNDAAKTVAEEFNMPLDIINKYLKQEMAPLPAPGEVQTDPDTLLKNRGAEHAEMELLYAVLNCFGTNDEEIILEHFKSRRKLSNIEYEDFKNEFYKNALKKTEEYTEAGASGILDRLQLDYAEDAAANRIISEMLARGAQVKDPKKNPAEKVMRVITDCFMIMRREKYMEQKKRLQEELLAAEKNNDHGAVTALQKEIDVLQKQIKQRGEDN